MAEPAATEPTDDAPAVALPYYGSGVGDVAVTDATLRRLAKSRLPAIVCAVAMFLYGLIGGFLGVMWLVVAIVRGRESNFDLTSFVILIPPNLIGSPLALTGGVLALRYHRAVSRALVRRNPEDFEAAVDVQLWIWRWASVCVIALFAMPPIILTTGYLVGVGR